MSSTRSNGFRPTLEVLEDRSTPSVVPAKIPQVIPPTVHHVIPPAQTVATPKPRPVINSQPPYIYNPLSSSTAGITIPHSSFMGNSTGIPIPNFQMFPSASTTTSQSSSTQTETPTQATQDLITALEQPFTFGVYPSTTK